MENSRLIFLQSFIGKYMQHHFSPVAKWLNGKLLSLEDGVMKVEYLVREDMCNPMRTLHGGIAATILDDVTGTLVYALGRDFACTSVNLNCDFLSPAIPGDLIIAECNIVRAGKNIVHVTGQIVGPDGRIIAKCASNLIQTSFQIPPVTID